MPYKNPEPDDSWFARLQQQAQDYELAREQFQEWLWEQPVGDVHRLLTKSMKCSGVNFREIDRLRLEMNSIMEQAATLLLLNKGPSGG